MSYNYNEIQPSFNYLERGLTEVYLQGMEAEQTAGEPSSAPTHSHAVVPPFHYLINEQAKSIAALQELQNEVTALLEFRDLVMETFPHLRAKTEPSTPTTRLSLQGKRDWEPGIRVRRKLRDQDSSLVTRSRSNSHGKASKSEAGNSSSSTGSSAVQDSGFCPESNKECTGAVRKVEQDQEAEDELWILLELIQRKGTKLRLEVEHFQDKFDKRESIPERRSKSLQDLRSGREPIRTKSDTMFEMEVEGLRRERDILLDRVTEMEAENLANLTQTSQLLSEVGVLTAEKRDIEEQLQAAIHTKTELNTRIQDLHSQCVIRSENRASKYLIAPVAKIIKASPKLGSSQFIGSGSYFTPVKRSLSNEETIFSNDESPVSRDFQRLKPREEHPNRIKRTSKELSVLKSTDFSDSDENIKVGCPKFSTPRTDLTPPQFERLSVSDSKCSHIHNKLGTLDGIVSYPSVKIKGAKGVVPNKEKTAAILKETNVVELQRHLLTTSFENEVVKHKLREVVETKQDLTSQLEKLKEDNEDLKFQLEEKSIELEGTRARVRLLEKIQAAKLCGDDLTLSHTLPPPSRDSTPTPLLTRLTLPPAPPPTTDHSSSTESAHHDSPRRRPSKIPLKSYTAPKPPSVKSTPKNTVVTPRTGRDVSIRREYSRPASRESLNPPSSVNRRMRKSSNQDGSISSTNSTLSTRRDPPSSPAPKKIPSKERIISSDSDSKRNAGEYPDSLVLQERDRSLDTDYFDSIDDQSESRGREALAECDSLELFW